MTCVDRQLRPDVQLQQRDQRQVGEVSRHQPRVQQVGVPGNSEPELAANHPELPIPGAARHHKHLTARLGDQARKGQSEGSFSNIILDDICLNSFSNIALIVKTSMN